MAIFQYIQQTFLMFDCNLNILDASITQHLFKRVGLYKTAVLLFFF